jgi:hypothetical protein
MPDVVVYVDGHNLYHGLRSKFGRRYLWLDLVCLAERMRQDDHILKVRYDERGQRLSEPAAVLAARPASSRATGTRNGEQDT